ncbi:Atg5p [Sporobolomyces koalae]|uniref:Atg5p n=1 Tax=Sporobolomyces koalae TaxID=500713 RepID=UPI0031821B04
MVQEDERVLRLQQDGVIQTCQSLIETDSTSSKCSPQHTKGSMSRVASHSSSIRPPPSTSSYTSHTTTSTSDAAAAVFRHLNFVASVPIEFTFAREDLDLVADKSIEQFYLEAPRISYLPLILATIRSRFLALVLDEAHLDALKDDQIWFQDSTTQTPLKWHWPIGLLYDCVHAANHHSLASTEEPFAHLDATRESQPDSAHRSSSSSRSVSTSSAASKPNPSPSRSNTTRVLTPWKVTIHLSQSTLERDELLVANGLNECKLGFMARFKESDHVRFGNSRKRLVNLRKDEQDQLWQGLIHNDFDQYWSIANKLIPLPPPPPTPLNEVTASASSDLKNLAIRIFVVDCSNRSQPTNRMFTSPVTPFESTTGQPTTLYSYLSTILPTLFPSPPPRTSGDDTLTISNTRDNKVQVMVQGIVVPFETDLGWLASCMTGLDGWVNLVIVVLGSEP